MTDLSSEAIQALKIIKEEEFRSSANVNDIIQAINNELTSEQIMTMIGKDAINIILNDEGYLLTRVIIHMMSSEQRQALFVNLDLSLMTVVERVSTPINEYEVALKRDLYKPSYLKAIFGSAFISDLKSVLDVGMVSVIVKQWVRRLLCSKTAKRPPWVDIRLGDSIKATDKALWKPHKSSQELRELIDLNETDIDWKREDEIQDETKFGETFGYDIEIPLTQELRNRYSSTPKRGISSKYGPISDPNRLFGPLNSHLQSECDEGLDGCRMLTCTCHDTLRGICESCGLRIKDISYTLRYPDEDGGWSGEFCSMNCMTSEVPYSSRVEDLDLQSTGIADRIKLRKL
jgi:hypothetical protein